VLAPSWQVPDGDIHGTRRRADSGISVRLSVDHLHPERGARKLLYA
jgi:hypothetical protein